MIAGILRANRKLGKGSAALALLLPLLISSCSSITRKQQTMGPENPNSGGPEATRGGEVFGPFSGGAATQPLPAPGALAELTSNPDRIVLVFGRGLTHGYAYIGVLRALTELKVPIHAIYATEVGALAGALYFTQPNPNRIDWALLRFTEKNLRYPNGKFSFVSLQSPPANLSEKLRDVFGERRVESLSEKLHITLEDAKTREALEARSGELWKAVRGALTGVNGFPPEDFEGRSVRASARRLSDEYRIARQMEKYPVVVVTAGTQPPELFRKLVESQKATLISVPLPGIDDLDVQKRNQAVFSGKNAVHQAANEILGLIGRKLD